MCNVLAVTAAMAGAVSIPVLADVGTGWGDDGDVSRVVSAFESVGAGGICMEDTAYPKCNSLLAGSRRLSNATSFADRISTACAARTNDSFLIFARVEALVAGLGGEEALRRASLYGQAGADAIVIHAKTKCDEEVIEVVRSWQGTAPLVLIPTMYPTLSIDQMESYGTIGFVIYANQGLRAAIGATEAAMRQIQADHHAGGLGPAETSAPAGQESSEAECGALLSLAPRHFLDHYAAIGTINSSHHIVEENGNVPQRHKLKLTLIEAIVTRAFL